MKVGDLVKHTHFRHDRIIGRPAIATILYVNKDGGTLKVLEQNGKVSWFVTSDCEVISESGRLSEV